MIYVSPCKLIVKLLALALTNLVLDLANLVTSLAKLALANLVNDLTKPSQDLDKSGPGLTLYSNRPPHH